MTLLAEIGTGGYVLIGVLILLVPAVGYALYSRRGSGISSRPPTGSQGPGAHGRAEQSGGGEARGSPMDQHGTQ